MLAVHMGIDPRQIEKWPAALFLEIMELYRLDPFGPRRDNMHAAMVAQLIAAAHTAPGKYKAQFSDFMFVDTETRQRLEDQKIINWFETMKAAGRGKPS